METTLNHSARERKYGQAGFYWTQFLSGHGYFQSYLHEMRKALQPDCLYCPEVVNDPEHAFFTSRRASLVAETNMTKKMKPKLGMWLFFSFVLLAK